MCREGESRAADWLIRLMRLCLFNISETWHDNDTSKASESRVFFIFPSLVSYMYLADVDGDWVTHSTHEKPEFPIRHFFSCFPSPRLILSFSSPPKYDIISYDAL